MPRLGMGMPIVSDVSSAPVVAIDDFVFLNDVSGELTPNSTAVRKNLLLQSQTFKTTWTTNNAAIPNDLYTAPDSTLTAQAITATSSGASNVYAQQVVATTAGETYTYSAHVKAGANGFVLLLFFDGNTSRTAYFNTTTGSVGSASNLISTHFQKLDNGWFRVSITFQNTVTTSSSFVRIYSAAASGSTGTGASFDAGTDLLYIWGAQLEEDSRSSNYIVTTNTAVTVAASFSDVSEVWDFDGTDVMLEASFSKDEGAFDRATQNLVLNGDYEELGSELVTNGDFATDSDWTKGTGWTISGGTAIFNTTSNSSLVQNLSITSGKSYRIQITGEITSGALKLTGGSGLGNDSSFSLPLDTVYTHDGGADKIEIRTINATVGHLDNVSIKQVDPNDRWVLGTGWSISDGKAVAVATSSAGFSITQNNILTSNTQYEITYTVSDITAGSVRFRANLVSGTQRGSNGTYTEIITTAGDDFAFQGLDSFVGKIDNVTVTEYAITPKSV